MANKQIYPRILVLAVLLWHGCANDNKKTAQPPLETQPGQAASNLATDTLAAKTEDLTNQHKTGEKKQAFGSNPAQTAPKSDPPGPVAYVAKETVILYTEPNANAKKIQTLKQYDNVYLLETIMTNPQGKMTDYPTWYRVECQNKKRGWVIATQVGVGGGG